MLYYGPTEVELLSLLESGKASQKKPYLTMSLSEKWHNNMNEKGIPWKDAHVLSQWVDAARISGVIPEIPLRQSA